jgi:hypothetical protein
MPALLESNLFVPFEWQSEDVLGSEDDGQDENRKAWNGGVPPSILFSSIWSDKVTWKSDQNQNELRQIWRKRKSVLTKHSPRWITSSCTTVLV